MKLVDEVAVGWLMNIILELGTTFVAEDVPFNVVMLDVEDEDGVTRIYLVTWDSSSALARFTPVLPINSCVKTWETPEPLTDWTPTLLFNLKGKWEPAAAFCTICEIFVSAVEPAEILEL